MFSPRALIIIGSTAFSGVALAWILPPTTPIGGPTVSELTRSPTLAAYHAPPAADPPPIQPAFDPQIRGIDLMDRGQPELEHAVAVEDDAAPPPQDEGWTDSYREDSDRAFRKGFKFARHERLSDPDECERFDDQAKVDGCRSYFARLDYADAQ